MSGAPGGGGGVRDFGLDEADFAPLGEFAAAGLESTRLALARAARSSAENRVPIAGAAVHAAADGTLTTVAVGNNGRIPAPGDDGPGYPTDHGETATVRAIVDVAAVDWDRVVFTTTLSPCIMCYHTLAYLHGLGLCRIVVAESESFGGTSDRLAALPGMTLLPLTNDDAVRMMKGFARAYPWDWSADIGMIPPGDRREVDRLKDDRGAVEAACSRVRDDAGGSAGAVYASGVLAPSGELLATAADARASAGGNPALSAPMIAMGRAGSSLNLRDAVLVVTPPEPGAAMSLDEFGPSSLGACKLFRPGLVATDGVIETDLRAELESAGVAVSDAS